MLDFNAIRNDLKSRLSELEARSEKMEAALRSEHSSNFSEQALEREGEEVLERLEEEAIAEIIAIKAALERIEAGTYGSCVECGAKITEKRLAALPFANRCVECAE